jgi:hypothetical protein
MSGKEVSTREQERLTIERELRNLEARARRRGIKPKVLAQREWIAKNPVGFELG